MSKILKWDKCTLVHTVKHTFATEKTISDFLLCVSPEAPQKDRQRASLLYTDGPEEDGALWASLLPLL